MALVAIGVELAGVLAVAVTVIEVSLIVSLMLSDAGDASSLARDTVFAAIMIILNGIVGLCLLAGGVEHGEQRDLGTGGPHLGGDRVRDHPAQRPSEQVVRPLR